MKPSVILALAVACLAAPLTPQGAYKDALDIINGQASKFNDAGLKKRHGEEPDSFNIVFKDGVSIDQIFEHLKLLDGLINKDSLNGIKKAFDLPSQKDGSGLMGYSGHFDKKIVDALGKFSDLVTVEEDRVQKLPTFESFKSTSNVFEGGSKTMSDDWFSWWKNSNTWNDWWYARKPDTQRGAQPIRKTRPVEEAPTPAPAPQPEVPAVPSSPDTFQEVPTKNWGLFRVSHKQNSRDQTQYAMNKKTSNPTVAYIVDSGIRTSHRMFEGRASWGANFADNQNIDFEGHGTHVAGTVGGAGYGVSPSTKLIAVKVFSGKFGSTSQIMQGVSWAIDDFVKNKAKYPRAVINFSGGGDTSEAEDALFRKAVSLGMVVAVAAGNENSDACYVSPARAGATTPGFITVAASSADDSLAFWNPQTNKASNWGRCIDVIAPGTEILSADYQSDTGILSNSGTSMATPHVAGLAVQMMATSSELLTPAQVEERIINNNQGKIHGRLNGTPNKLAYNGSGL
ncbi:Alkaline extracellular protease [Yarrowia sp. C11]|nr:Alkaline extracellular protease [Yarrowia sp. E02]KAG5367373.1 Alkaline extracellular protease [Yarrowia sp. C11]